MKCFIDICSGIGGGRLGLEFSGMQCVGRSDTSRLADATYLLMHGDQEKNYGNIKKIKCENLPEYDILIAGFPCQSFSVIGRQSGFDDSRGQIIFHIARIIDETQPECFILENVKGLVTHNNGNTLRIILELLESKGYDIAYKVISSLNHGVPQMRQRIYIVGFRKCLGIDLNDFQWPEDREKAILSDFLFSHKEISSEYISYLKNYLNNETNKGKYTLEDLRHMEGKILDTRMNDLRIYDSKCPTLRAQRDGILYVYDSKICELTGEEALLLQGFPIEYIKKVEGKVSNRHLLMQAGNAMTVNVIEDIGNSILKILGD